MSTLLRHCFGLCFEVDVLACISCRTQQRLRFRVEESQLFRQREYKCVEGIGLQSVKNSDTSFLSMLKALHDLLLWVMWGSQHQRRLAPLMAPGALLFFRL